MAHTISRIASLVIALPLMIAGIIDVIREVGFRPEVCVPLILLLPLALIWFPEVIGSATGYIGHGAVDVETPPFLVVTMGWLFLIGIPLLFMLVYG